MKTSYVVVDDFYDDPWEVRQRALELEYKKLEGSTYHMSKPCISWD